MNRALRIAGFAACLPIVWAAAPRSAAAADRPTPGKWELTMQAEFEGMPNMPNMPGHAPTTMTTCIKPEETQSDQSFAERMTHRNPNSKCQLADINRQGNKLSFSFTCSEGTAGTTEMVFGADTYEVTTHAKVPPHGPNQPPMTMTQHVHAKRVGDC